MPSDGHSNRIVEGQFNDSKSQFDPRSFDSHGACEDQWVAVDTLAGEIMLGEPDGIHPQFFGQYSFVKTLVYLLIVSSVIKFSLDTRNGRIAWQLYPFLVNG
ncbi:MAG: hypothetical protein Ct9H300mP11_29400 [Chloroflexota bacterium]|nr:MAG: hypothetical protein Ct9H300mP11_29400 [Chloroflexota bacterium]